jgi:hypothetical protein
LKSKLHIKLTKNTPIYKGTEENKDLQLKDKNKQIEEKNKHLEERNNQIKDLSNKLYNTLREGNNNKI